MRILRFGSGTAYSNHWCVYGAHIIPTSLIDDIDEGTTFFVTKDVGSGIEVDEQYTSFPPALARWTLICNDSANDAWLPTPRDDIEDFNPFEMRIESSILTDRLVQ